MTTYLVATAEPPTIVCPPWCTVPAEEHIADLENWEGMVLHWSSDRSLARTASARIGCVTTPSGTPDPTDPISIHPYALPDSMSPAEALAAGRALIALANEALA